jgi:hypothetical protein
MSSTNTGPSGGGDATAQRRAALLEDHQRFLRTIATSRSLPHVQSSIAGAGGTTWQHIRKAQAGARSRAETIEVSAADAAAAAKAQDALQQRAETLDAAAAKRKAQRDKKKKAKRASVEPSAGKAHATSRDGSDSASDAGAGGEEAQTAPSDEGGE